MTDTPPQPEHTALTPADLSLLTRLHDHNQWLRALLCTLARRGTLLRLREPQRATALIDTLSRWPWFKGGQFFFDLMEWEDFMVDGPPPPLLSTALGTQSLHKLTQALTSAGALLDDAFTTAIPDPQTLLDQLTVELTHTEEHLPPLQAGMHIYRDVILGIIASVEPIIEAGQRATQPPDQPPTTHQNTDLS